MISRYFLFPFHLSKKQPKKRANRAADTDTHSCGDRYRYGMRHRDADRDTHRHRYFFPTPICRGFLPLVMLIYKYTNRHIYTYIYLYKARRRSATEYFNLRYKNFLENIDRYRYTHECLYVCMEMPIRQYS